MKFFGRSKKKDDNSTFSSSGSESSAASPSNYSIVGYGGGDPANASSTVANAPAADATPMDEGAVYSIHPDNVSTSSTSIPVLDGDAATDEELATAEDPEAESEEDESSYTEEDEETTDGDDPDEDDGFEEIKEDTTDADSGLDESEEGPDEVAAGVPAPATPETPTAAAPAVAELGPDEIPVDPEADVVDEISDEEMMDVEDLVEEDLSETELAIDDTDPAAAFPENSTYPPPDPALTVSSAPTTGWADDGTAEVPPNPESGVMAVESSYDTDPVSPKKKKKKKKKLS